MAHTQSRPDELWAECRRLAPQLKDGGALVVAEFAGDLLPCLGYVFREGVEIRRNDSRQPMALAGPLARGWLRDLIVRMLLEQVAEPEILDTIARWIADRLPAPVSPGAMAAEAAGFDPKWISIAMEIAKAIQEIIEALRK